MGTKDFAKFVARQQQEAEVHSEVDWRQVQTEWLADLDSLYKKIIEFLEEYIANHSVSYSFTEVKLTEGDIGEYSARQMEIVIGRQRFSIVPVGTLLIGSKGRVDVQGFAGQAQILLVDERARGAADLVRVTVNIGGHAPSKSPPPREEPISWAWKIVTNTLPRKFVVLDRESFLSLLMELANA